MEDAAAVCGMELGSLGGEPLSLSSQSLKRPGEHGLSTSTGADTDSHSGSDGTNDRDLGESKRAASARPFEEGLGMDLDEDHRMFSPHADSSAGFEKLGASEGSRLHTRRDSSANLLNFLEEGDPSSSTASKRKLNQVSDAQMDGDGSNVPSAAHQPGSRQARDPALDEQARYYTKTITGLGRENYFLKQQFAIANSQVMQLSQELAIVHEQLHSLRLLVAKMPSRQALVPPEQRMVSQCVRYALDCSASGSGAAASGMGMMDGIGNGGMEGGGMVGMGPAYSSMDMHSTQQNQPPLPPNMHRHLFKEGQTAASGGGQDAHVHDASHMQRGRKLYRAAGDMPEVALLAAHERSAVDKAFSYRGESGVMGWNDAWMMRSSRGLGTEASLDHGPTTSRQMDHEEAVQHEASATAAAAAAAQHVSAAGGVGEAGACQAAHTAKDSERASAQRSTQAEGNQANEEPPSGARESSADVKGSEGSKRDGGTSGGDTEGGKEKEVGKASSKKEGGARDKGSEKGESGGQPRFWTADEHKRFLEAVRLYGYGNARHIAAYVQTRNITQVRTHAQKYILKLSRMGSAPNKIGGQQQKAAAGAAGSGRASGIAAHSRGQEQDSRNAYRLSQEEEDLSLSFLGEKTDSAGPEESAYVGSMGADAVDPHMRRLQADMGSGFGSASYGTGNLHPYSTSPMPMGRHGVMYEGMGGMMGGRGMPMSVMGPGGGGMMMDGSAAWGIHHDSLPPDATYIGERSDL